MNTDVDRFLTWILMVLAGLLLTLTTGSPAHAAVRCDQMFATRTSDQNWLFAFELNSLSFRDTAERTEALRRGQESGLDPSNFARRLSELQFSLRHETPLALPLRTQIDLVSAAAKASVKHTEMMDLLHQLLLRLTPRSLVQGNLLRLMVPHRIHAGLAIVILKSRAPVADVIEHFHQAFEIERARDNSVSLPLDRALRNTEDAYFVK